MIEIRTDNPCQFIEQLNNAIAESKTAVWSVDKDGDYFLQTIEWSGKGWMRPLLSSTEPNILRFGILEPNGQKLTKTTYSVLHCRFAEMLLTLFDTRIVSLSISPLLTKYDTYSHS